VKAVARKPRVGWTLNRRIQIFLERKLLDLSLAEARQLHGALGRAIDHADRLPGATRAAPVRRT
jgi:hypothetical protein